MRFQRQNERNCLLRADLKPLKEKHFRQNYEHELNKPKYHFRKLGYDEKKREVAKTPARDPATLEYETKYFLTDAQ